VPGQARQWPRVNGPTVVKLGGSFAFSPHLRDWIAAIANCTGRALIVPGGGPFADSVRTAQVRMGFDDRAAHRMGLLAMEQYGCAIASLDERLMLAQTLELIRQGLEDSKVPVWLPAQMALGDAGIPQSWDVTSDSLAAWLADRIGAERLLLVKHVDAKEKTVRAADLAARNVVDTAFADFLTASGVPAFMLGPMDHGMVRDAVSGGLAGIRIIA
jgi:5-(aminomethyl)-3-furanmethanol phosphate kinase